MGRGELEFLRLVLTGGSVIDWPRLHFCEPRDVDHFLARSLFVLDDARDEMRLRGLVHQAEQYLHNACGIRVPRAVAEVADLRTLFLLGSRVVGSRLEQRAACSLLKCVRIAHHLQARELLHSIALSEADLAAYVDRRVRAVIAQMRQRGLPVVGFAGSPKGPSSVMTKLLVKQETVAAQVFDRLRYRLVTARRDQIAPLLVYLAEHLFPFCNVISGQTENRLLDFATLARRYPSVRAALGAEWSDSNEQSCLRAPTNTSTAHSFRSLKFVVELPIRADGLPGRRQDQTKYRLGHTLLPFVEFQIVDSATAERNERGVAAHSRYKDRQIRQVKRRLLTR
jgi:uncharacterized protein (TIGR04552 family)